MLRVRRGRAEGEGVTVETSSRGAERFDDVVFATHSDITLALLGEDADPAEAEVLRAIPYNDNEVYLHTGGWVRGSEDTGLCRGHLSLVRCPWTSGKGRCVGPAWPVRGCKPHEREGADKPTNTRSMRARDGCSAPASNCVYCKSLTTCAPLPFACAPPPTDQSLMPRNRKVWSSWNFIGSTAPGAESSAVCVSYWANRLQELPPGAPDLFVTLNPPRPPAADHVIRRLTLAHPVFRWAPPAAGQPLRAGMCRVSNPTQASYDTGRHRPQLGWPQTHARVGALSEATPAP